MSRRDDARVAMITGASSGIGEASARALAQRGWDLVIAARRVERLQTLAAELRSSRGVRVLPIPMDVTQVLEVETGVNAALAEFGRIDVLVNDAGVGFMDWLEDLDPAEQIEHQLRVNLLGAITVTRSVLRPMQAARRGHLIYVASLASYIGTPTYTVYAASKFGLRGFAETLRREVGAWGIRVSLLVPGAVATGFAAESVRRRRTGMTTPRAFLLSVDSVGEKLAWLASHPRRTVVMPPAARAAIALNSLLPGVLDWLTSRFFVQRERRTSLGGGDPQARRRT